MITETFKCEADELLMQLEEALIQSEGQKDYNGFLVAAKRILHNLKGSSGVAGFPCISKVSHELENLIMASSKLTAMQVETFLSGLDLIRRCLDNNINEHELESFKTVCEAQISSNSEPKNNKRTLTEKPEDCKEKIENRQIIKTSKIDIIKESQECPRSLKALVIEDNKSIANVIGGLLEEFGLEVCVALNGADALENFNHFQPDIIISDYNLGCGMSGMDLLKIFHAKNPVVPFIFISGYVDKEMLLEAVENGAIMILEKPLDVGVFTKVVCANLKKYLSYKRLGTAVRNLWFEIADLEQNLHPEDTHLLSGIKKESIDVAYFRKSLVEEDDDMAKINKLLESSLQRRKI